MLFGISSAPEVFQHRMHEIIEGMQGVEVVADDFVVVGFGNTLKEATLDHDRNLDAFLRQCQDKNLRLNEKKIKLRMQDVPCRLLAMWPLQMVYALIPTKYGL